MTTLDIREPIKRILARCIKGALPDVAEAQARLEIAVRDGHFTSEEAAVIALALELETTEEEPA